MRLEFINRVKENEVLGRNIFTNDGNVLLRSGVRLTEQYIKKLKQLGVFYVYIEDARLDDISVDDYRLDDLKQATIKSMSSIMKNISNGNSRCAKGALTIVEDLVEYIIELGDINKSLYDIKTYDNYTYVHCLDTGIMSTFLGLEMNYSQRDLKEVSIAGILHDVGKTKISDKIIKKEGALTKEEFEEIRKHPVYGSDILRTNISFSNRVVKAVEQHHERVDGKGYPYGLINEEISKFAKVVCICDVYDAVSNDRCYRRKFSPSDAYELILAGSGVSFDMDVVQKFRSTFSVFPLGCCVKLSNGVEGYVIRQNHNFPDRPIIRVLYDSDTRSAIKFYEVDLLHNLNLTIKSVI